MIRSLLSIYSWRYPAVLVRMLQHTGYRAVPYLKWYWRTNDFARVVRMDELVRTGTARKVLVALRIGMALQIAAGLLLVGLWQWHGMTAGLPFGAALIVSYPVVWAHIAALAAALRGLARPKAMGRAIVCRILEAQVGRLRRRHDFRIVAVAGSAGKTSTKIAIARVLQASRRVRWQEGNYNDRVTVPLIFFGRPESNIYNVLAWFWIFLQNEVAIRQTYPYDMVVVELATDGPGFIKEFAYVKPQLAILTAIDLEHMEFFGTLDAVAEEELGVTEYATKVLVNTDDTPKKYLTGREFISYGLDKSATYHVRGRKEKGLSGQTIEFVLDEEQFALSLPLLGAHGARIALAAAAAAHLLGVPANDIKKGLGAISAFAGRMQVLYGIKDSTIIDDTYNASPVAVKAALNVLYSGDAPQRIAILGSMNELGDHSPAAHKEIGEYCDPKKLDLVVTIGSDAEKYLAPVAKKRGCHVESFLNPYEAGKFVRDQLREGAVILAKGSQNRVFAEEALKALLADKKDESKLVRQSAYWMKIKQRQFIEG